MIFDNEKRHLILTHGIPGCGKSTFVAKHFSDSNTCVICPDDIRDEFRSKKEEWGNTFEYRIWKIVHERLKKSLENNNITVIDATFISRKSILKEYKIMNSINSTIYFTIIDFSDILLEDCLRNNVKRGENGGRFVPEDVIKTMYSRIKETKLLEFEDMVVSHKSFGEI